MLVRGSSKSNSSTSSSSIDTAALGMWVFLATEVMFFGTLFLAARHLSLHVSARIFRPPAVKLCWQIGGINTIVLLVSSLTIVLAVHYAKHGYRDRVVHVPGHHGLLWRLVSCAEGSRILHRLPRNLIPGWASIRKSGSTKHGLRPDQVPHVKLFLLFYWIMTLFTPCT